MPVTIRRCEKAEAELSRQEVTRALVRGAAAGRQTAEAAKMN